MPVRTLKEIYEDCISLTKRTSPKLINGGSLYKWRGYVDNFIIGELKFDGLPNFGLTIFDETHVLPCLILNPVKNFKKLLKLYGDIVLVNNPELVVEIFVKTQEYSAVHVLINAAKVHTVEKNILQFSLALKESKSIESRHDSDTATDNWEQKFIPLKVSSVLLTFKSKIFCLILASLVDSDAEGITHRNFVWLIFRNGQTLWKDLLLPYQVYNIVMPGNISCDYFSKYSSLTSVIDDNLDVTFLQILHHKDFVKTVAAVFLPEEAKIIALASPRDSIVLPHSERWFSVSDSKLKYLKFASIVGVIREIKYFDSYKSKNCIWCSCGNAIFEATLKEPPNSEIEETDSKHEWSDAFTSTNIDEDEDFLFPDVSFNVPNEKITGFGIKGGKMCFQITLQQHLSFDVVSVFIKRWQMQQYPAGLATGMTVCITDVNVKRSQSHKSYYVCTPFTRILHLSSDSNESLLGGVQSMQLIPFGFPSADRFSQNIWGIIELDLPLKVSIKTKCKRCHHSFLHYTCTNTLCLKFGVSVGSECEIVASARLFVHNFCGSEFSTLYLKDENVQKYLGLPGRIWRLFCNLSANGEFCYLHQREELEPESVDAMALFFYSYCKYFRPKKRFHVICRQFKDDVNRFFCVDLEEITEERVAFASFNFEKAIELNKRNKT